MKRLFPCGLLIVLIALIAVPVLWAGQVNVKDTKHNLASGSAASIRSTSAGTDQVCVFCHTPHGGRNDAPLWNRTNPTGSYTTYTSDVLTTLGLTPEDPGAGGTPGFSAHVKTRICISCHDGTIALGSLINMPSGFSGSEIPMMGSLVGNKLTAANAGYVGTDLSDDHPVAVKHVSGMPPNKDPELKALLPTDYRAVRLYDSTGHRTNNGTTGAYVECTSCHDPHDNQWTNFLVASNASSGICTGCHTKQTGGASGLTLAHDSAGQLYNPDNLATIGTTVGNVKCMNCHYSHRAGATGSLAVNPGYGKYLLSWQEDNTCFNNTNRWGQSVSVCHGSGSSATNASGRPINIEYQMTKSGGTSAHSASKNSAYSGKHSILEQVSPGYGNGVNHVVCADCHNAHTAGGNLTNGLHVPGTNTIAVGSTLYGAGGVQFSGSPGWAVSSNFTPLEPLGATTSITGVTYEYEICLKCHSSFAWGASPTGPAISDLFGLANMTDQAKEMNTGNVAYHTVMGSRNLSSFQPPAAAWNGTWSANSLMYCSDCHGNNTTVGEAQGTHGSTNAGLLVRPFSDTYGTPVNLGGTAQAAGDLCFLCHTYTVYGTPTQSVPASGNTGFADASINMHTQHAWRQASQLNTSTPNVISFKCVNCHARVPHGYFRRAMVVVANDGASYEAGGLGTGKISSSPNFNTGLYVKADCATVNGCHQ